MGRKNREREREKNNEKIGLGFRYIHMTIRNGGERREKKIKKKT